MERISNVCKFRGAVFQRRRFALLIAATMLGVLAAPASAFASWWNHDWPYRKQIAIDGGPQGANLKADLDNVTVLIRLHDGVFKFSDANPDGADLRFVAADDKTPLKYHIEKFDPVFDLAFVWVQIPKIKAGAAGSIWMYYGNPKAVTAGDARESYDADQALVYHFAERATPVTDATAYGNNSASVVAADEGALIGTGARFDGQSAVVGPASPSLAIAAGGSLTWSAWLMPAASDEDAVIYARHDGTAALVIGLAKGAPYVAMTDATGATQRADAAQPLSAKGWHRLTVVAGGAGAQVKLFVDGLAGPAISAPLPALNAPAMIGGDGGQNGAPIVTGYNGELDEVEISKVARDPAFVTLAADNQGTSDKLIQFGADEAMSSWSSGYVGVILHSVTLDGWVIITILVMMALISWTVMVRKAGQIIRVSRANAVFLKLFRASAGDFAALGHIVAGTAAVAGVDLAETDRERMRQSPLLHMFKAGVDELRQRLGDENRGDIRSDHLSTQSIEAIRATIDSHLVQENQALNRLMVLLTVAISGGPFIGLLGTVVGVMITFAAIAASGDVNINSIAPGIAAALVATIAGLLVAIPALFGYNYLLTRIKEITAEMQVFVDAFIARMAENYNVPAALHAMADDEE